MKKKTKIVIPFAVLTLTCGISAGVLAGCNSHEHNYSDWKIDGEYHVRVCPDDGATDESTRGKHEFFGGVCECGANENEGKVFSTASGQIKLHKLGGYETDYTGITIDMGDDDVQTELNTTTGKFTITDAEVGKIYNLKISKAGYKDYDTTVKVAEGRDTVIGGVSGAVLEYEAFGLLNDYDGNYHDFSHVNEETPYFNFLENDGSKTLNVLSTDKYSDVSATMHLKFDNSLNNMRTQGIVLKFDDGKHVIVRYHNGDVGNGNIQYATSLWDLSVEKTLFVDAPQRNQDGSIKKDADNNVQWNDGWAWGEHKLRDLTDAEGKAIKADGIDLNVILKDGVIYTFLGGAFIESHTLPEGYANKQAQIGYFVFNTASNAKVYYGVDETVPAELKCNLNINVTQPTDAGCEVTKSSGDNVFELTDNVELIFTAAKGYRLSELTVAGEDRYGDVVNGKLTIPTNRLNLEVKAVFTEIKDVALNITVKGNKLGETYNLAEGTQVQFRNSDYKFEVGKDGKITGEAVTEGRYTVVVDGYFAQEINFVEGFNEVTLEHDTFKQILDWGSFNFDNQNAEKPSFGITNDCAMIFTNDTYDTAKASVYLKGNGQNAGNVGIMFRFVGDDLAKNGETVTLRMEGNTKIQFAKYVNWDGTHFWGNASTSVSDFKDLIFFEDTKDGNADAKAQEYLEKYKAGTLKLTAIREGATVYVYLDDRFIGVQTFDSKYENVKCEVGFIAEGLGDNKAWKYWNVEITEDGTRAAATLTDGTTDTHGEVTLPSGEYKVGDTVQLSVAPKSGYIIKKLTVGGVDVTSTLTINKETKAGTCNVLIYGDASVVAEFEEIVNSGLESVFKIHKLGETVACPDTTEVTLSNVNFTYTTAVANGKIDLTEIAAGTYTVSTDGAVNGTITVTAEKYTTDIVLEYVTYTSWVGYDDNLHDYSEINNAQSVIKVNGDGGKSLDILSTDKYTDMTATIIAKDSNAGFIQGIVLQFEDGNAAIFNLKTDQSLVQFRNETWGHNSIYGNVWKESEDGSVTQADKDKFNSSNGIEVKLVRYNGTLYCYVDGRQVYSIALPEKYATDEMQVGFFAMGVKANASWEISVSTDIPSDLTTPTTPEPSETDPAE